MILKENVNMHEESRECNCAMIEATGNQLIMDVNGNLSAYPEVYFAEIELSDTKHCSLQTCDDNHVYEQLSGDVKITHESGNWTVKGNDKEIVTNAFKLSIR